MLNTCWRDATSGKTPPYRAWMSICEATVDDRSARPFSRIAQAVSSQDVSIARMRAGFNSLILLLTSHFLLILFSISSSVKRNHTDTPRGLLFCHRDAPSRYLRCEIPFLFQDSTNQA